MTTRQPDDQLYGMTHAIALTGLSAKTIASYETAGLIRIRRDSNGDRLFTEQDIVRIRQIREARELRHGRTGKRRVVVTSTTTRRARDTQPF